MKNSFLVSFLIYLQIRLVEKYDKRENGGKKGKICCSHIFLTNLSLLSRYEKKSRKRRGEVQTDLNNFWTTMSSNLFLTSYLKK